MTALPEAKLAREAGICYAMLACVTDYDTWHDGHAMRVGRDGHREPDAERRERTDASSRAAARSLPERTCAARGALTNAIITPMHLVPDEVKRDLAPILDRAHAGAPAASVRREAHLTVVERNSAAMPGTNEYSRAAR